MEKYTKPEFKVIKFEVENVITASAVEVPVAPGEGAGGLPVIPKTIDITE